MVWKFLKMNVSFASVVLIPINVARNVILLTKKLFSFYSVYLEKFIKEQQFLTGVVFFTIFAYAINLSELRVYFLLFAS